MNTHAEGHPAASLRSGWVWILGALTAIGPLSIDMYLPSFPAIEHGLGANSGSVELTLASYFIGMAVGQLFYGPFSDRFGRKPPLYAGLALYFIASIGCMLAQSVEALTSWRLLQGLGGCAGAVIARAIVRDRCGAREAARVFSMLILVMGLAPMLAPLLGGQLLVVAGWRALFGVLAGFAVLCLASLYLGLPESHRTDEEPPLRFSGVLANYARLLGSRSFLGYTLSGGLVMAGMFAYIAGSPFVMIQLLGLSPQHFAVFFGLNALGFVVASQLNARLLRTLTPTSILHRALWLPIMTGGGLVLLQIAGYLNLYTLLPGLFLFVSSVGLINPNASAAALATHGQQAGTASALMGAVQFAMAMLSGVLVSLLHDGSALPLCALLAVCGAAAFAVNRWLVYPLHHGQG